jgi:hypothetical protein
MFGEVVPASIKIGISGMDGARRPRFKPYF